MTKPVQCLSESNLYLDPSIRRKAATYLLNSDATFVGTNTTNSDTLNQNEEMIPVNGIRAFLEGTGVDLCEPTA